MKQGSAKEGGCETRLWVDRKAYINFMVEVVDAMHACMLHVCKVMEHICQMSGSGYDWPSGIPLPGIIHIHIDAWCM